MAINLISVPPYSEQFSNQMAFAQVREDDPILSRVWKYPLASLLNVPVLISAIAESIFSSIGMLTFYFLSAERSESFKERAVNSFQVINLSMRRIFWLGNARQSEVSIFSKQNASQKGVSKASESDFQSKALLALALGVICSGAYYFDLFGKAARLVLTAEEIGAESPHMSVVDVSSPNATGMGICPEMGPAQNASLPNRAIPPHSRAESFLGKLPLNIAIDDYSMNATAVGTCPVPIAEPVNIVTSHLLHRHENFTNTSTDSPSFFSTTDFVEIHKTIKSGIFLFGVMRLIYDALDT